MTTEEMKRFAIYCVTYNSYKELYQYLDSICTAVREVKDTVTVDVFVADNTDKEYQEITYHTDLIHLRIFAYQQNLGYFGGIRRMMEEVSPLSYDYTIISNVDMFLHADTLRDLCAYQCEENTGWIAPAILSKIYQMDLNPQSVNRYTLKTLRLAWLTYRIPFIHDFYAKTFHKQRHKAQHPRGYIYAGHGSFFILTKQYFQRCGPINYPIFLYDEELYVAEECRLHGLKVMYEPSISVSDIGKVSTGKTKRKLYRRWNAEGITYIIRKYY